MNLATTTLQIPIDVRLRNRATKTAKQQGFSSLQEAVRIFLSQLVMKNIQIGFMNPTIKLSAKNDARYDKMIRDVETGKVKTKKFSDSDSIEKIMNYLNK